MVLFIRSKAYLLLTFFLIALFLPRVAWSDPIGREGLIPVTEGSYFFVDNATLFEPYASLDQNLPPLDLSRLLNQAMRFPTMHYILKGDRRVIGVRVLAKGRTRETIHSTWAEDLTLLLPAASPKDLNTQTFQASQIVGVYSTFSKEGWRSIMGFVAYDGTVTISTIDKDKLNVTVDLMFKRTDVDYSLYINDNNRDSRDYIEKLKKKDRTTHASMNLSKTFIAHRKDYRNLSFWEGNPGDEDVSEDYNICSRCYYDPETRDMFKPRSE